MPTPVKALKGSKLLVQIGNGATPTEAFAHDCLINTSRGIQFSAETSRSTIPYCDEPDLPAWSSIAKDSLSATITGAGILNTSSVETWWDWFTVDEAKNVRVVLSGVSAANGGGYWQGPYKLTSMEITGEGKQNSEVSVTLESDGELVWTPAQA